MQIPDKWIYTNQDCNQNDQPSAEPSIEAIETHRKKYPKVTINVGGVHHEVMWKLFHKRPLTRLGMLAKVKISNLGRQAQNLFGMLRLEPTKPSFSLWTPIPWTRMKFISTETP